jgi:hypothetical protein
MPLKMNLFTSRTIGAALFISLLGVAYAGLLVPLRVQAQKDKSTGPDLAAITARGRLLAEYDIAASYSTDAVQAKNPDEGSVSRYIARKIDGKWTVAYGRFSPGGSKFLIVYEAKQADTPEKFTVEKRDPPLEDAGFFLFAARGIEVASRDFPRENRDYNISVLPAESNQFYVYFVPAQMAEGVYPLGGDARYLMSPDGLTIVEKRQLHKSIVDTKVDSSAKNPAPGHHTDETGDVPEDTDVFYVLWRKPSSPEYVKAGEKNYLINADGTIKIVK